MRPIMRQEDQWPDRVAANKVAWGGEYPEHPAKHPKDKPPAPVRNDDVFIMPGEQSGLYGEDEDHPYDAIVTPSGHGNSYDVIHPFG